MDVQSPVKFLLSSNIIRWGGPGILPNASSKSLYPMVHIHDTQFLHRSLSTHPPPIRLMVQRALSAPTMSSLWRASLQPTKFNAPCGAEQTPVPACFGWLARGTMPIQGSDLLLNHTVNVSDNTGYHLGRLAGVLRLADLLDGSPEPPSPSPLRQTISN